MSVTASRRSITRGAIGWNCRRERDCFAPFDHPWRGRLELLP
ncbi:hypothetical protein [Nocardia sp. CC201C]|nr:hypothetical protein [Nocardia sp. CC201C]